MWANILIFVSKRAQRCAAAVLVLMLLHVAAAAFTPEPGPAAGARIDLRQ